MIDEILVASKIKIAYSKNYSPMQVIEIINDDLHYILDSVDIKTNKFSEFYVFKTAKITLFLQNLYTAKVMIENNNLEHMQELWLLAKNATVKFWQEYQKGLYKNLCFEKRADSLYKAAIIWYDLMELCGILDEMANDFKNKLLIWKLSN